MLQEIAITSGLPAAGSGRLRQGLQIGCNAKGLPGWRRRLYCLVQKPRTGTIACQC